MPETMAKGQKERRREYLRRRREAFIRRLLGITGEEPNPDIVSQRLAQFAGGQAPPSSAAAVTPTVPPPVPTAAPRTSLAPAGVHPPAVTTKPAGVDLHSLMMQQPLPSQTKEPSPENIAAIRSILEGSQPVAAPKKPQPGPLAAPAPTPAVTVEEPPAQEATATEPEQPVPAASEQPQTAADMAPTGRPYANDLEAQYFQNLQSRKALLSGLKDISEGLGSIQARTAPEIRLGMERPQPTRAESIRKELAETELALMPENDPKSPISRAAQRLAVSSGFLPGGKETESMPASAIFAMAPSLAQKVRSELTFAAAAAEQSAAQAKDSADFLSKLAQEFRRDSSNQRLMQTIGKAEAIRKMLTAKDTSARMITDRAIRTIIPRLMGEVGNLAKQEQEIYGVPLGLWNSIKSRAYQWFRGEISPEHRKALISLIDKMSANLRKHLDDRANAMIESAKVAGEKYGPYRFSEEELKRSINPSVGAQWEWVKGAAGSDYVDPESGYEAQGVDISGVLSKLGSEESKNARQILESPGSLPEEGVEVEIIEE